MKDIKSERFTSIARLVFMAIYVIALIEAPSILAHIVMYGI